MSVFKDLRSGLLFAFKKTTCDMEAMLRVGEDYDWRWIKVIQSGVWAGFVAMMIKRRRI